MYVVRSLAAASPELMTATLLYDEHPEPTARGGTADGADFPTHDSEASAGVRRP
jgi:hypothetical protein